MTTLREFFYAGWGGKAVGLSLLLLVATAGAGPEAAAQAREESSVVMAIHGGAGTILPESMTEEEEEAYRAKLTEALEAGYAVLGGGGTSIEAVLAAITIMEDSPLFNAGVGAVLTNAGTVEHDASIMDGETLRAGAVAGVKHIKNPIMLAHLVMEESEHVMLAREGAEAFAEEHGLELVPNEHFYTERRRAQLERQQQRDDARGPRAPERGSDAPPRHKYGTVGAVALDQAGNLAAGTSTGGMSNKRWGRIGDSPIIGAGTYADNETCAVSSTGHGEYFIRGVVAHDIASMMRYAGRSVGEAAEAVIMEKLPALGEGGTGGVVALDAEGHLSMPFNTPGMYRGFVEEDGTITIRIYKEDN